MRSHIRHFFDIPMQYRFTDIDTDTYRHGSRLKDVCEGGLCFYATEPISAGSRIQIKIPIHEPAFEAIGVSTWCHHQRNDHYEIGIQFEDKDIDHHLHIVEQACHIKHYMRQEHRHGRDISGNQAAQEWITKYADDFPSLWDKKRSEV